MNQANRVTLFFTLNNNNDLATAIVAIINELALSSHACGLLDKPLTLYCFRKLQNTLRIDYCLFPKLAEICSVRLKPIQVRAVIAKYLNSEQLKC